MQQETPADPAYQVELPPPTAPEELPRPRSSWKKTGALFGGLFMALGGLFAGLLLGHHASLDEGSGDEETPTPKRVVHVTTVLPQRKSLVRQLEQPGTIQAYAQAEIYAKASGYLKRIQRVWTARNAASWLAQELAGAALNLTGAAPSGLTAMSVGGALALDQAPQLDIGASVKAGDVLLEIDAPELRQDVLQKESLWQQAQAEMEQSRSNISAAEAAIEAGKAQLKQAQADTRRAAAERKQREEELDRWKALVRDKVIAAELGTEKINQVNATIAALEGTEAKVQAVQAEQSVLSSKLATARAELKVRETRVRVALDEWRRAQILAEYALVRAPFDGIVTKRDVDEGDFVQNSTTGQTRRLMVVAAIAQVKIALQVPDKNCPWIRVGAPAEVILEYEGRTIPSRVSRSSNALDPQTRTMQVEIDLDNPGRQLRPGDYVKVNIVLQKLDNAAVVPANAVYTRKNETYILLANGGSVRRQPVQVRYDDGLEMEVGKLLGGKQVPLSGTEELILNNRGDLRDGQKVKATRKTAGLRGAEPGIVGREARTAHGVLRDFTALVRLDGARLSSRQRLPAHGAAGRTAVAAAARL